MTQNSPGAPDLTQALRRVQRGVLLTLVVCALVIVGTAPPADDGLGSTDRRFTLAALALAVAAIVARHRAGAPGADPRRRLRAALAAFLFAGSIGLVGVALAVTHGEREAALLYTLAGAILALRPPTSPPLPRPRP